jgi:hypothetical protein
MTRKSVNTIVENRHRLTAKGPPDNVIEIDSKFDLPREGWWRVMRISIDSMHPVLEVLHDGDLYLERIKSEADGKALPAKVKAAAGRLPSLQDLLQKRYAEVRRGELALLFLPWIDDEGYTQFAVDMVRFPMKGKPKLLAQLGGGGEIRVVMSLLRKAVKMVEQ